MSNSKLVTYTQKSPNYTAMSNKKNTHIVIHHMAGKLSVQQCGNVFASRSRQASSNYGVSGKEIGLYVDEKNRSWATSSYAIDSKAVTIETANSTLAPDWKVSDTTLDTLIKLCADICKRNGIKKLTYTGNKNGNLHLHKWYSSTSCPGPYLQGKMKYIASEVNKKLGAKTTTKKASTKKGYTGTFPTLPKKGYLGKGDTGTQVKNLQKFLNWYGNYKLVIDGSFGNATLKAVKSYQKKAGLTIDGYFGKASLSKAKTIKK